MAAVTARSQQIFPNQSVHAENWIASSGLPLFRACHPYCTLQVDCHAFPFKDFSGKHGANKLKLFHPPTIRTVVNLFGDALILASSTFHPTLGLLLRFQATNFASLPCRFFSLATTSSAIYYSPVSRFLSRAVRFTKAHLARESERTRSANSQPGIFARARSHRRYNSLTCGSH